MRPALVAIACAVLPACSLIGLGQHRGPTCDSDDFCAPLNEHFGLNPDGCDLFQCDDLIGSCVRRQRDEDEDGLVAAACGGPDCDDTAGPTTMGAPIVESVPAPGWIAWADAPGSLAVAYPLPQGAGFDVVTPGTAAHPPTVADFARDLEYGVVSASNTLESGCVGTAFMPQVPPPGDPIGVIPGVTCETHLECQDGNVCNGWETCEPNSADPELDARKCRPAQFELCSNPAQECDPANVVCLEAIDGSCRLGELAIANARDDEWFAAAIDVSGCPAGRLYAGWMSSSAADLSRGDPGPNVVIHGDRQRALGFGGIDIDASGCTGASRSAGEPRGASWPVLATLPPDAVAGRRRPQALLAWSACPQGGCTAPAEVEVLGLVHEQSPWSGAGRAPTWITPLADARPQRLSTRSRTRVAATTVHSSTPDCGGGVLCGYVLAYGAHDGGIALRYLPMLEEPTGIEVLSPYHTPLAGDAPRITLPIDLGAEQRVGAALIDAITIAAAPELDGTAGLRIVWIEGGRLLTAESEIDPTTGMFTVGEPVELSASASQPQIVYAASGVCGPGCAGYAVTWVEAGGPQLWRVGTSGRAVVGDPISLGQASGPARAFADGDFLRVVWHDASEEQIVLSSTICAP